jgi:hypothetical protein
MVLAACNPYQNSEEYTWTIQYDSAGNSFIVRGLKLDRILGDLPQLVYYLNGTKQDPIGFSGDFSVEPLESLPPKLQLISVDKLSGRVIVQILNGSTLTQRMGTTGVEEYIASVVFTLTEHPWVQEVDHLFESGDHAASGIYSRASFPYLRTISN